MTVAVPLRLGEIYVDLYIFYVGFHVLHFHCWFFLSYLFYDVNPGEGFNLRRDVYMRIAVLVKHLNVNGNWILVRCYISHVFILTCIMCLCLGASTMGSSLSLEIS